MLLYVAMENNYLLESFRFLMKKAVLCLLGFISVCVRVCVCVCVCVV